MALWGAFIEFNCIQTLGSDRADLQYALGATLCYMPLMQTQQFVLVQLIKSFPLVYYCRAFIVEQLWKGLIFGFSSYFFHITCMTFAETYTEILTL